MRRRDGSIHTESHPIVERAPRLRGTFLRGPVALVDAVSIGMRALRVAMEQTTGAKITSEQLAFSFVPVFIGVLGVFVALPGVVSAALDGVVADVVEGAARPAMLVLYLLLISRAEPTKRLFGYHGAEHMTIAAYEHTGEIPDVARASIESPVHRRCGSSFIALFAIVAGVAYAFVPREPIWLGAVLRIALSPVVAAVAYEVMRASAIRGDAVASRLVSWPGRALQRITTRPPDTSQLEVAVEALRTSVTP